MVRERTLRACATALACGAWALIGLAFAGEWPKKGLRPPDWVPQGVKAMRGLEYANAGGKALLLDLYLPEKAEGPTPVIVWVHGGAWQAGSKEGCPALRIVPRGYAAASLNYRLSQEAIFPAQIEDCKAAIRWLRAHAKEYNLDPARFGAWGASAGGHLVALLGTAGDVKELAGTGGNLDQPSRVQAVCDFFGPTDFCQMAAHSLPGSPIQHDDPRSPESLLIGGALQENKDKAARANPITYVTQNAPPFLILHGDKDPLVPHHQSEILAEALKKAGVEVTFHTVAGAGHGFGGPQIDKMVDEFFDRHLKPAPQKKAD